MSGNLEAGIRRGWLQFSVATERAIGGKKGGGGWGAGGVPASGGWLQLSVATESSTSGAAAPSGGPEALATCATAARALCSSVGSSCRERYWEGGVVG